MAYQFHSTINTTPTTPSFPSFPWEIFTPYYSNTHVSSSSPTLYVNHRYSPPTPYNPYPSHSHISSTCYNNLYEQPVISPIATSHTHPNSTNISFHTFQNQSNDPHTPTPYQYHIHPSPTQILVNNPYQYHTHPSPTPIPEQNQSFTQQQTQTYSNDFQELFQKLHLAEEKYKDEKRAIDEKYQTSFRSFKQRSQTISQSCRENQKIIVATTPEKRVAEEETEVTVITSEKKLFQMTFLASSPTTLPVSYPTSFMTLQAPTTTPVSSPATLSTPATVPTSLISPMSLLTTTPMSSPAKLSYLKQHPTTSPTLLPEPPDPPSFKKTKDESLKSKEVSSFHDNSLNNTPVIVEENPGKKSQKFSVKPNMSPSAKQPKNKGSCLLLISFFPLLLKPLASYQLAIRVTNCTFVA
ncbi:uncharacterized protein LOC131634591 [Vicia villosa]|uniref:uncharacterized protein LOC131634591 n=1 Tax=Vicia villosa TaxID=3911 RepID=UPI00273B564E|nr:uncharacterized protein LOC131634591 [Vicia villosa]